MLVRWWSMTKCVVFCQSLNRLLLFLFFYGWWIRRLFHTSSSRRALILVSRLHRHSSELLRRSSSENGWRKAASGQTVWSASDGNELADVLWAVRTRWSRWAEDWRTKHDRLAANAPYECYGSNHRAYQSLLVHVLGQALVWTLTPACIYQDAYRWDMHGSSLSLHLLCWWGIPYLCCLGFSVFLCLSFFFCTVVCCWCCCCFSLFFLFDVGVSSRLHATDWCTHTVIAEISVRVKIS